MRRVGFEPTRPKGQRLLRPPCLPFHHRRFASRDASLARHSVPNLQRAHPARSLFGRGTGDQRLKLVDQCRRRHQDSRTEARRSRRRRALRQGDAPPARRARRSATRPRYPRHGLRARRRRRADRTRTNRDRAPRLRRGGCRARAAAAVRRHAPARRARQGRTKSRYRPGRGQGRQDPSCARSPRTGLPAAPARNAGPERVAQKHSPLTGFRTTPTRPPSASSHATLTAKVGSRYR